MSLTSLLVDAGSWLFAGIAYWACVNYYRIENLPRRYTKIALTISILCGTFFGIGSMSEVGVIRGAAMILFVSSIVFMAFVDWHKRSERDRERMRELTYVEPDINEILEKSHLPGDVVHFYDEPKRRFRRRKRSKH
jgi:hypothetical protein